MIFLFGDLPWNNGLNRIAVLQCSKNKNKESYIKYNIYYITLYEFISKLYFKLNGIILIIKGHYYCFQENK